MSPAGERDSVLVTGARGRLGRLLVDDLRARGTRVVALGRTRAAADAPDDLVVDLRDPEAVTDIVQRSGVNAIVHLASLLRGEDLVEQNRLIDAAVAGAARAAGIPHVVYASSAAVYGTANPHALTEDSPLDGESPYAASKRAGEERFAALVDTGASVTALRIFNIAGPAFPESLVHKLLHATPDAPVTVVEPERFVRDYIHESDVVAVLRTAVEPAHKGFSVVNVGAGVPVSTTMLLASLDVDDSCVRTQDGGPSTNWADISRMIALFGVRPRPRPTRAWEQARL